MAEMVLVRLHMTVRLKGYTGCKGCKDCRYQKRIDRLLALKTANSHKTPFRRYIQNPDFRSDTDREFQRLIASTPP